MGGQDRRAGAGALHAAVHAAQQLPPGSAPPPPPPPIAAAPLHVTDEYARKYCEKNAEALSHCQLAALRDLASPGGGERGQALGREGGGRHSKHEAAQYKHACGW